MFEIVFAILIAFFAITWGQEMARQTAIGYDLAAENRRWIRDRLAALKDPERAKYRDDHLHWIALGAHLQTPKAAAELARLVNECGYSIERATKRARRLDRRIRRR